AAFEHQDVPFERLVEILNPPRSLARHPLFQTMLILQNTPRADRLDLPGVGVEQMPIGEEPAQFDLSWRFEEDHDTPGGGLRGRLEYRVDLFDRATAESMVRRFVRLLEQVAQNPGTRVSELA